MNIKIKRDTFKVSKERRGKVYTANYPIASRYEDNKLQVFSFMTELKGR